MLAIGLGIGITLNGGGRGIHPAGFRWNFGTYPVPIQRSGNTYSTTFNPQDYAVDALAGVPYYVNFTTGNNANTGLSTSQKLKSIHTAVTKGNAGGVPFKVIIDSDTYPRNHGLTNSATVSPTQKCAFVANGGRVLTGSFEDLTWTLDTGATYKATRSNVRRVVDPRSNDAFGDYTELVKVADAATCRSTPASWAQVVGDLYVHLGDGAAVTNANAKALLLVDHAKFTSVCKDIYMSGIDMIGGQGGTLQLNGFTGNFMSEDCTTKFSGGDDSLFDGVRIIDVQGLCAFKNHVTSANAKDGFNCHRTAAPAGTMQLLTIGCTGKDNGRYTSQSNNGWTLHEDCIGIDINGYYSDNYGGTFHIIDNTQAWALGTTARKSKGDIVLGGGLSPQEFRTESTAKMWLQGATAEALTADDFAVRAKDTSTILKRGFTNLLGTEVADVGATIGNF